MTQFKDNSIYWVEVDRIRPNPYQPRREFNESRLSELAESIRQYGILQPLVVTRHEKQKENGGIFVDYELIAGERRLRASTIAGLSQVPVMIRTGEESDLEKLELAIIENIQREDLNPMDRARAFGQLIKEFKFKHNQIAQKVGKSREYVSNTVRLLTLPNDMQQSVAEGDISEGHARPLLMLSTRPEEQTTLYKEILLKKLTVRETESIARKIATDRVRKKEHAYDPEIVELEQQLTESLGTRVQIESKDVGGKIVIDFFSEDDLRHLLRAINPSGDNESINLNNVQDNTEENADEGDKTKDSPPEESVEQKENDDGLYSVTNFSV